MTELVGALILLAAAGIAIAIGCAGTRPRDRY